MSLAWSFLAALAFALPSVGESECLAGMPYAAESALAAVSILCIGRIRVNNAKALVPAAVACLLVDVLLVAVTRVFALSGALEALLVLLDAVLRVASLSFGSMSAADGKGAADSEVRRPLPIAGVALSLASGAAWYAATAWLGGYWGTFSAAFLSFAVFLSLAGAARAMQRSEDGSTALAGFFVGILAANRLRTLFGSGQLSFEASQALECVVALAPVALSAMLLLLSCSRGALARADEQAPSPAETAASLWYSGSLARSLCLLEGYESLTSREADVLECVLGGDNNLEAAKALGIAASTVATYKSRAFDKLGIASTQEALARVRLLSSDSAPKAAVYEDAPLGSLPVAARFLAMLVAVLAARAALPSSLAPAVQCAVAAAPLCFGFAGVAGTASRALEPSDAVDVLSFAATGVLVAQVVSCSVRYLAVCAAFAVAGSFLSATLCARVARPETRLLTQRRPWPALGMLAVGAASASLVPQESSLAWAARTPALGTLFAAVLLAAAYLLFRMSRLDHAAACSQLALSGDARAVAYLQGRGANEMQAKAALLTAYGFDMGYIADALCVSKSAVSGYRVAVYRILGLHDRRGLCDLLEREAGFGIDGSAGKGHGE